MKKLLLISALAVVASLSSYGQGSVGFANNSSTRVWMTTTAGGTTYADIGSRFSAELMYAPDGASSDSAFDAAAVRVGGTATFGPVAGLFNGGGRTVANMPLGGFGMFQVRVWETAAGTDYRDAFSKAIGQVGKSAILRVDTADPTTVPPGTPTALTAAGLTAFTVSPVPEPSVIALGVLGVGALLMLRRRK